MNEKKIAVAYIRVSTQGQIGEDKFGIDSQKDMIKEYCEKNNIEIREWYVDEGVSGAKEHRPAFDRLLEDVENPPVRYVVVAKADRISRDINIYYAYKGLLTKRDVEIISVLEDWSAQDKLTAMILENFLAMAAMIERENIKVRLSSGRKQKAKQGGYAGGQPMLGYDVISKKLVINKEEAKTVRKVFELRDEGYTVRDSVNELNRLGLKSKRGSTWHIATVQRVLANENLYRGLYRYGEGSEWIKGQHEAILKD